MVRHKLWAVSEEMVETMVRTSFSPLLNQSRDFSAVVLDADARILAQAERLPIHMGAMPFAVRAMANAFAGDIADGDVLMANDPYWGGSHLPDITLAKPIFQDGELRLWVSNRAHQGDIGGLTAGGYSPEAREIWHEGVRVPPVKFVRRGTVREDLLRLIVENTRKPEEIRGDIMAQFASVIVGAERLAALFARYGAEEIEACAEAILAAGEAAMRHEIARWTPGTYEGVTYMDTDGCGNERVPLPVRITLDGGTAVVDFRDCPDQVRSYMNSSIANTTAAVSAAFMFLCDDPQSQNEGIARVVRILTRKGSLLDCEMPAPVTADTTLTASSIVEAVMRAMQPAAPERAVCGFARRFRFVIAGIDRDGRSYIWHHFANLGGSGANMGEDGWPHLGVVHSCGGTPSASVERTEASFPLFVEQYALRPDSGGAGTSRGGLGGIYALRYEGDGPAVLNAAGDGVLVAPHGLDGGRDGATHDYRIVRDGVETALAGCDNDVRLEPGERIVCRSAGGGGYGDPSARDPEKVRHDVTYGYVLPEAAREVYGAEP